MKKILLLIILTFMYSCLLNISERDIETPRDTINTLQWTLNRVKKDDFFHYFEELFAEEGQKIVKKLRKMKESTEQEDKENWSKFQEMFEKVIIKLNKVEYKEKIAHTYCTYFFPDNFYMVNVEIILKKTKYGWQIINIKDK